MSGLRRPAGEVRQSAGREGDRPGFRGQPLKAAVYAGKSPGSIDTWPGRRSGDMIVITSILSSLAGLLLLAFLAASSVRL